MKKMSVISGISSIKTSARTLPGRAGLLAAAFSRRRFIRGAGAVIGTAVGTSVLLPRAILAGPRPNSSPKPTTNSFTLEGKTFHIDGFGPGLDPSAITDFNGFVGVADVQGTGTGTYADGSSETLLFDTDMRFMKGEYVGEDGVLHRGAFVLVWLDLYRGQFDFTNFSTQVHDFDPGISPYPDGLFWTVSAPTDAIAVEMGAGKATLIVDNLQLFDFFDNNNAVLHFRNPASVAAACSFAVQWASPVTNRSQVNDPIVGFAGEFVLNQATMQWSASNADGFRFVSNPSRTTSAFAQLGYMRNGVFY